MNKVLIIAYYFPPMGMGGVQRTLKFAKYLTHFGWQPVVITDSPKKYFAVDNYLLDEAINNNVIIERTGKGDFDPKNITVKTPNERFRKLSSRISQTMFIPDSKIRWKNKALKLIDKIWDKYGGFQLVFATAPPYTDFLIGQAVKKKYKIPLVIDYRDAWVDSPVLNFYPTPFHKMSNVKLEKSVLRDANKIITTNRRVKELVISRYGNIEYNEVKIYPHGYDQEDFEIAKKSPLPVTSKFRVTYSGSFYTRSPKYYLKAIKLLLTQYPELKNEIEFCFIGQFTKDYVNLVKELGIYENLNLLGYQNHIECVKYLLASDLLFLFISRGENDDAAMPGKVGEYIGSRKPILACIPEGVTKKMLEKYNAVEFILEEDTPKIAYSIRDFYLKWKSNSMPEANDEMVKQYDRKPMAEELAKEFNHLLDIE